MAEKRYTTKEAAKIFNTTRQAVGLAIKRGVLPAHRVETPRGAYYYILESDMNTYAPRRYSKKV